MADLFQSNVVDLKIVLNAFDLELNIPITNCTNKKLLKGKKSETKTTMRANMNHTKGIV